MSPELNRVVLATGPESELMPDPPGGGFEPDSWISGVGFDTTTFFEGLQSGIVRQGQVFFWQDFSNPQNFLTSPLGEQVLGFSVRTYWSPPPGFWAGFLRLTMQDTDFNSVNIVAWKQDVYRNQVPRSDSLNGWATVVFPFVQDIQTFVDFSKIFSVGFTVGPTSGGPGFDGDGLVDDMRMVTVRGGNSENRVVTREVNRGG